MDDDNQTLSDAIEKSIISSNVNELLQELGEFVLDSFLDNDLLKDIPMVGWLIKARNIGVGVKDILFTKKLIAFLSEISDVSDEDRKKFLAELDASGNGLQKAGESIAQLLDNFDRIEKAKILGKLVKARISGIVDFPTFERLSSIVDRVYFTDLKYLVRLYKKEKIEREILESLANAGLVSVEQTGMVFGDFVELNRSINKFGKLLVEIALMDSNSSPT